MIIINPIMIDKVDKKNYVDDSCVNEQKPTNLQYK